MPGPIIFGITDTYFNTFWASGQQDSAEGLVKEAQGGKD